MAVGLIARLCELKELVVILFIKLDQLSCGWSDFEYMIDLIFPMTMAGMHIYSTLKLVSQLLATE